MSDLNPRKGSCEPASRWAFCTLHILRASRPGRGIPRKAELLGGEQLTPAGAPRAGSEDGVIPEWDGGIEEPPPHVDGYDGPGDFHPDPYAGDDPRFTVTADNMDDYSEYLTQGTQALLETYPETYELKVYPSRRSAAMPDWVAENTRENATEATLVANGDGIDGAYGGIPFPILHRTNEDHAMQAIWNPQDQLAGH